jgi:hypothetical protein
MKSHCESGFHLAMFCAIAALLISFTAAQFTAA